MEFRKRNNRLRGGETASESLEPRQLLSAPAPTCMGNVASADTSETKSTTEKSSSETQKTEAQKTCKKGQTQEKSQTRAKKSGCKSQKTRATAETSKNRTCQSSRSSQSTHDASSYNAKSGSSDTNSASVETTALKNDNGCSSKTERRSDSGKSCDTQQNDANSRKSRGHGDRYTNRTEAKQNRHTSDQTGSSTVASSDQQSTSGHSRKRGDTNSNGHRQQNNHNSVKHNRDRHETHQTDGQMASRSNDASTTTRHRKDSSTTSRNANYAQSSTADSTASNGTQTAMAGASANSRTASNGTQTAMASVSANGHTASSGTQTATASASANGSATSSGTQTAMASASANGSATQASATNTNSSDTARFSSGDTDNSRNHGTRYVSTTRGNVVSDAGDSSRTNGSDRYVASANGSSGTTDSTNRYVSNRRSDPDTVVPSAETLATIQSRSFNGEGNNVANPEFGASGTQFLRTADANFADGIGEPIDGPNERYISNRIFQDLFVNVPDENQLSHTNFTWGQFLDHNIARSAGGTEDASIAFDPNDPLENFNNDLGVINFKRDQPVNGTGKYSQREFSNDISSYIDGFGIYGPDTEINGVKRVDRLRDPSNPAKLEMRTVNGEDFLPYASDVGIDDMDLAGRLKANPDGAVASGDIRANVFGSLTSYHTLFAREHNRVVDELDSNADTAKLSADEKFSVARQIVSAEIQAVTYNEYLPSLGLQLDEYKGYDPTVDATLSNEFAIGFRFHSAIHGELNPRLPNGVMANASIAAIEAQGAHVTTNADGEVVLNVPAGATFGNPGLVEDIGLDAMFAGLQTGVQYNNDEQIDNQARSLLFQVPNPGHAPGALDGPESVASFNGVTDLGAIGIARGRDRGVPLYNDMREALGLNRVGSFEELAGEMVSKLPEGTTIDDPAIIDFVDPDTGKPVPADQAGELLNPINTDNTVREERRVSTLAARLKAVYGSVDRVDLFVGMMSEPNIEGTSMGPTQTLILKDQFTRTRDGDRFFYQNEANGVFQRDADGAYSLAGVKVSESLRDVILDNTELPDSSLSKNVFFRPTADVNQEDPASDDSSSNEDSRYA